MTDSLSFEKGIYIFNPDTDFALASGSKFYTPPSSVLALRNRLSALPALYAPEGSAVLLFDKNDLSSVDADESLRRAVESKKIDLISASDLQEYLVSDSHKHFYPWGWNPALRHFLIQNGANPAFLPSESDIDIIRQLSHRRMTVEANRFAIEKGISSPATLPLEITDVNIAARFLDSNPGAWFKAPWSSSGRGVINSCELHGEEALQWIRGTIRRQGSVMGETAAMKKFDFASEWFIKSPDAILFCGLSMFETSNRGKYKRNLTLTQEEMRNLFNANSRVESQEVLEIHKEFLQSAIAPSYSGPVGIDMIVEQNGEIRPFIEINLRMTMGMVALFNNQAASFRNQYQKL